MRSPPVPAEVEARGRLRFFFGGEEGRFGLDLEMGEGRARGWEGREGEGGMMRGRGYREGEGRRKRGVKERAIEGMKMSVAVVAF